MISQDQRGRRNRSLASGIAFAACILVASPPTVAQQASLEGSWSGGGTIVLPSGDRERAQCRATFRRSGGGSFGMNAVCATSSARVAQTAELARVSGNRFSGSFYNAEYSISGSIVITVQGNRLSASLNGGGGSAYFNLGR
jgi:hypothetical protein